MEMAPLGSWIIIAVMTIGLFVLGWWFFMENPMAKDKKNRENKEKP
jgi:hypothetical protein